MARKPRKPGSHVGRDPKHRNKSCLSHHQRPKPKKEPRTKKQKLRARQAKRNKKVPGWHTKSAWHARAEFFGWKCYYCGCSGKMTKDHRQPRARGGSDWPANLVPACLRCNERKADKDYDQYMSEISPWE